MKIIFDYRLLAIFFFLWGVLNTTDGLTESNFLNLGKGIIALTIAAYYAFPGNKVTLRYKRD